MEIVRQYVQDNFAIVVLLYLIVISLRGLVFLPSTPVLLIGVVIFPPWQNYWLNLIGIVLSSFIVITAIQRFGFANSLETIASVEPRVPQNGVAAGPLRPANHRRLELFPFRSDGPHRVPGHADSHEDRNHTPFRARRRSRAYGDLRLRRLRPSGFADFALSEIGGEAYDTIRAVRSLTFTLVA